MKKILLSFLLGAVISTAIFFYLIAGIKDNSFKMGFDQGVQNGISKGVTIGRDEQSDMMIAYAKLRKK